MNQEKNAFDVVKQSQGLVKPAGWKRGQSGNPAGRPRGSLTKKTVILKVFTETVLSGGRKKFQRELRKLKGKQYIDVYLAMLEFGIPKIMRSENTNINLEAKANEIKQVFSIGGKSFEF